MPTSAELERVARRARNLIDAALANHCIRAYLDDPTPPCVWTVEGVRRDPTCRVEWEYVTVIGGVGEALAAAKHKRWGVFLGVRPLRPDDPVSYSRILYVYKEASPYNRRVEHRKALKRILGRRYRKFVTLAARNTKRDFLARHLTEAGADAIRRRLNLDPGRFWRAAQGKDLLHLLSPPRQLPLFPE